MGTRFSGLRRAAAALSLTIAALGVAAPAMAADTRPAETRPAADSAVSCTVSDAKLVWGFKESFRSYISSNIAKGSWDTEGNASYATPSFTWSGGSGTYDPATGAGELKFTGGIQFHGHGGLLDTKVLNPTVVLKDGVGTVRIDVSGVSMDRALAGDKTRDETTQAPFVTFAAPPAGAGATALSVSGAETRLTAEGNAAFTSYETGSAFDPITLTASLSCVTPTPTAAVTTTPAAEQAPIAPGPPMEAQPPYLLWIGIGVAVVIAGAVVVVVLRRRSGGTPE